MTKIKTGKGGRLLTLAVAILMIIALLTSLTACGERETYEKMGKDESVEDFVARIIAENNDRRLRFIAASRGYDIKAENFKEPESNTDVLAPNTDAAAAVIDEIITENNFANANDKKVFDDYRQLLSAESILAVANNDNIKTSYNLKVKNSFPSILLVWIGKALGALTGLVGDYYLIAIIVFAVIVEILMMPMSIKQQKNTIGMAKLRPAIARIEKKYAGRTDQVTMRKKQEEIMELQQKEGYSPFAGCLPMLIQLIIVGFILYPIIQNPLQYVLGQSSGFSSALLSYATSSTAIGGLGIELTSSSNVIELLAIFNADNIKGIADFPLIANGEEVLAQWQSLSVPKFTAFGINLGKLPAFTSILVLVPVLNILAQGASMFLMKRWNSTGYNAMGAADAENRMSMRLMDFLPLLITVVVLFQVPAMIGLYWFFRSLISLLKQFILRKAMPVPQYTAEELREIERAERERQKAQKAALKQQPKVRSLHYIDADDYDELPEIKTNTAQGKKFDPSEAPEIKD